MAGGHAWQGGMHGRGVCMVGGVHGRGACMVGGMCGRGCAGKVGMHGRGCAWQGACMEGGVHGGEGACNAGKTSIVVGGTHPTGMHSCFHCHQDNENYVVAIIV